MAKITEKRLYKVDPQAFTSNGTAQGELGIADTKFFVVGHIVVLKSGTQLDLRIKIKRIPSSTSIIVGDEKTPIHKYTDISAYLVADGASIEAEEQPRPKIPEQEIERLTYDEEPIVARRVSLIDEYGDHYGDDNPVPVEMGLANSTPFIYNISAPLANTEYSQLLPSGTTQFDIRARNESRLQISYIAGDSILIYRTVPSGSVHEVRNVRLVGRTIYFIASKNNTIVEITGFA